MHEEREVLVAAMLFQVLRGEDSHLATMGSKTAKVGNSTQWVATIGNKRQQNPRWMQRGVIDGKSAIPIQKRL